MHHHHLGEKVRMERKVVMANHEICSFCRHVEILFILSYVLLWITRSFIYLFFLFIYYNFFIFVLDCFMHHPRFFFFFFCHLYFLYCICNLVLLNAKRYGWLPTSLKGCYCLVSFYDTQVFIYHVHYFPYSTSFS